MNKTEILEKVKRLGLLAVLRGPSADVTVKMVEALIAGGVCGIEVTYTTPNADEVVKQLDAQYGDEIVLGMGTCRTPEQVEQAAQAGARFLVSPHTELELAAAMRDTGLLLMMGALTPSEVEASHRLGSDVVKIFPGSVGGPEYMKALKGPFPDIPMMPTGGVSEDNIGEWFKAGAIAVGAGSQLCPKELALAGRFDEITAIAKGFVAKINAARET